MTLEGLRVLVVEDEAMLSMMLEEFLMAVGCEVAATASRLDDALEKARDLAFDAAILDVNLDGCLSYPVADVLRLRRVPVVFATGYGSEGLPAWLEGAEIVSKPFKLASLVEALARAVASQAAAPPAAAAAAIPARA